jgi:hypothetical protein
MIKRIRYLAGHGLSLMMVLSNFLSRRITPLHSRIHPAWQFTWEGDTAQDFTPEGTTACHPGTDGAMWNAAHDQYLCRRCRRQSPTGNQCQQGAIPIIRTMFP